MISSKTLKDFVKMHEYKLNAKINRLRAEKLDAEIEEVHWGADCLDDRHHQQATEHWQANRAESEPKRSRPDSRYFNFILTPTQR